MPDPRQHWVAHPSFLRCGHRHRLFASERRVRLEWLADGFVLAQCRECQPPSYVLAVACRRPTPWAACYSLSKTEYDQLTQLPDDLNVLELLSLIHVATEG